MNTNDKTECNDNECGHFDDFFDDNCGGSSMENCLKEKTEPVEEVPCSVELDALIVKQDGVV